MNMKEFLKELEIYTKYFTPEALNFYTELVEKNTDVNMVTEAGAKILKVMAENEKAYINIFSSKQIGELLFMPARSVSGSLRKLVTEGYATKGGNNPVTYSLTDSGRNLAEELKIDKE